MVRGAQPSRARGGQGALARGIAAGAFWGLIVGAAMLAVATLVRVPQDGRAGAMVAPPPGPEAVQPPFATAGAAPGASAMPAALRPGPAPPVPSLARPARAAIPAARAALAPAPAIAAPPAVAPPDLALRDTPPATDAVPPAVRIPGGQKARSAVPPVQARAVRPAPATRPAGAPAAPLTMSQTVSPAVDSPPAGDDPPGKLTATVSPDRAAPVSVTKPMDPRRPDPAAITAALAVPPASAAAKGAETPAARPRSLAPQAGLPQGGQGRPVMLLILTDGDAVVPQARAVLAARAPVDGAALARLALDLAGGTGQPAIWLDAVPEGEAGVALIEMVATARRSVLVPRPGDTGDWLAAARARGLDTVPIYATLDEGPLPSRLAAAAARAARDGRVAVALPAGLAATAAEWMAAEAPNLSPVWLDAR